jgi:hypothetical protein
MFALPPKSGHQTKRFACPLSAMNGLMHRNKPCLHSITSAPIERRGYIEPKRLGGLHVDHQLELGRLLNGQFARFGPFQDLSDIACRAAIKIRIVYAVSDQPPGIDEFLRRSSDELKKASNNLCRRFV